MKLRLSATDYVSDYQIELSDYRIIGLSDYISESRLLCFGISEIHCTVRIQVRGNF
ncbi:MAG: hypothetical protein LBE18_12860 [Planctomycetaceae bacterium]|nr:hypothetical protein [Planctomycetaceae bacterium]